LSNCRITALALGVLHPQNSMLGYKEPPQPAQGIGRTTALRLCFWSLLRKLHAWFHGLYPEGIAASRQFLSSAKPGFLRLQPQKMRPYS
jgi:hypothetical protein